MTIPVVPRWRGRRLAALAASALLLAGCTSPAPPEPSPTPSSAPSSPATYEQVDQCQAASPGAPAPQPETETISSWNVVDRTWAGMPVGQALLTTDTSQYVAYYDSERQLILAQRSMNKDGSPTSRWRTHPLGTTLGWDSHNYVTMAVDRAGALHVAGNMHRDPLFYVRTAPNGDIRTAQRVRTMVNAERERSVTYPVFLRQENGSLIFYFRDGGSGSGSIYLYRYHEQGSRWTDVISGKLFSGREHDPRAEEDANAYITEPVLGEDGFFHVLWVWRTTPDVSTNSTLTYAKTKDFTTWFAADGTRLTTPFTPGTGDVVDPVPEGGGLVNGVQSVGFDEEGEVVVTYAKYDAQRNLQLYWATPDGGAWSIDRLTQWTNDFPLQGIGTIQIPVTVAGAVPQDSGGLAIDYTCAGAGMTLVVEESGEFVIQNTRAPGYGPEVLTVRGRFPGLTTRIATDLSAEQGYDPSRTYVLRWESLPSNRDRPRSQWPQAGSALSVLEVVQR